MTYTKSFPIDFEPLAHPDAVVVGSHVRFTVLTSRLLRLEYSPTDMFEDRPSQAFWYRRLPVPEYQVRRENGISEIETEHLHLRYHPGEAGFIANSLTITLKESNTTWHYGQADPLNLKGTTRTLDEIHGALELEEGLVSRSGWAVYNDTSRLVFNEDGWLVPRQAPVGYQDLYFFGFGFDYKACLRDFTQVTGPAPIVPRWVLGNWWSRYWAYSADELLGVMDEFKTHRVPLSVCIVDMDWHITGDALGGWTGYTWNRELFPDPPAFIEELHKRGLKTALNLHPADGVFPHEEQYQAMAERMGVDPQSQSPIPFDIANPQFTRAYFEILHHPREAEGVDFWWMDWQQGTESGLLGLDPLWWLNHLHYYDLSRDGRKRSFIFSRWGGLGNHRYPIGFSGDTHVSWESLAFQPYFTATAANVNYGWWSHDIGGHMYGIEEPELYTRWVQFGVFSPILRLHATNNPFHKRRPWEWDAETERVTSQALRLRHTFIPYLYTMAWRNHTENIPLIRPMYHDYPTEEPAYHCPDQYGYGSELIAAPFISPRNPDTRLSHQVVWLPEGDWFDFFNGRRYPGDSWHALYGDLDDIPVFAKAGAIVPLTPEVGSGSVDNPDTLEIHVFPGADNELKLYEDDDLESYSLTPITQEWSPRAWRVQVAPVQGSTDHLSPSRAYVVLFRGVCPDTAVVATRNGEAVDLITSYDSDTATLGVSSITISPDETLTVTISTEGETLLAPGDYRLNLCRKMVRTFRVDTENKMHLDAQLPKIIEDPTLLGDYELSLTPDQLRALVEVISGAGCYRNSIRRSQGEAIVFWNNRETDAFYYKLVVEDKRRRPETWKGQAPKFAILTMDEAGLTFHVGSQLAQGRLTVDGWLDALPDRFRMDQATGVEAVVQFNIIDDNGRTAFLTIQDDQVTLTDGTHKMPNATITANVSDWLAMINGDVSPEELFFQGKISVSGDLELIAGLTGAFQIAPPGKFLHDRWRLTISYLDIFTEQFDADRDE